MPNVWTEALKLYNKDKGAWCIPRKGSPEHKEITEIMNRLKRDRPAKAKPAPKKKGRPRKFETKSEIVEFMGGKAVRRPVRRRIRELDLEPTQENIDMLENKQNVLRQKIYKIVESKGRQTKESNELKDEMVFLGRKRLELIKKMRGETKQPEVKEMKQEAVPEATTTPLEDMSQKDLEDNIEDLKEEVKELKERAFRIVEMKGKETKESKRLMEEAKMLFREQIEYVKALKKKKGIKTPKIDEEARKKKREADKKKALEDFEKQRKALLTKSTKTVRRVKESKTEEKEEEKPKFDKNKIDNQTLESALSSLYNLEWGNVVGKIKGLTGGGGWTKKDAYAYIEGQKNKYSNPEAIDKYVSEIVKQVKKDKRDFKREQKKEAETNEVLRREIWNYLKETYGELDKKTAIKIYKDWYNNDMPEDILKMDKKASVIIDIIGRYELKREDIGLKPLFKRKKKKLSDF